ncbi:hypothetical protein GCM10009836_46990 [Pseudonocardia ailaonensis]|uniref:Uncharacterized protein n=1 Tax=Pseudonocardia ailaonensis TaxID=367279 RepID=A0ABN2NF46_9PSEU
MVMADALETRTSAPQSSTSDRASMPRDPRAYLWDAARAASLIEEFTDGLYEADT